ncbi:hypothetical protein NECAME_12073 [Necator americanus]|uniref:Leishmanolysin-like peptidase n=1 Tax=Necator americanus TaxID=51031 RepID=W2T2W2_NECAM|nr:hypothetical protein NECAME_12073 [Necator americanus]ETN75899.1 hypothetical protein NECAME_12073 [Necator americanus]
MQRNEMTRWLSMIKHELVHAFVFSVSHFTNFIGAKPATQHKPLPVVPGVIEKFTRDDWEVFGGKISHDVYMIVTPKVREEARKHFGCPTLEGAEIPEDDRYFIKAENMTWGKGLGCDFAKKSCLSWMKGSKDPYPFCTRALDMRLPDLGAAFHSAAHAPPFLGTLIRKTAVAKPCECPETKRA